MRAAGSPGTKRALREPLIPLAQTTQLDIEVPQSPRSSRGRARRCSPNCAAIDVVSDAANKISEWQYWAVFDQTEDHFRSRCFAVLTTVFMFVALAFNIPLTVPVVPSETVARVLFTSSLPRAAFFGYGLDMTPRVQLVNSDGTGVVNHTATTTVLAITQNSVNKRRTIACDTVTLDTVYGTLEYLRVQTLCSPVVVQGVNVSDALGVVSFDNLIIDRGPPGEYLISIESDGVSTQGMVTVASSVASLVPVNSPPDTFQVGVPFSTQPEVQVRNRQGRPVAGIAVVAFVWDSPHIFDPFAHSYANMVRSTTCFCRCR